MKPLPPYAKDAKVVADSIWIRCGTKAWDFAKSHPDAGEIIFPGDKSANEYRWDFVKGIDTQVIAHFDRATQDYSCSYPRMAGLCVALLLAGSPSVTVIDPRFLETHANCDWSGWMTFRLDELRDVG